MQGWIIPETQEDLIIAREQIDTPIVLGPGNESIISVANGDDMRRYIRFYLEVMEVCIFFGWEIIVKQVVCTITI